MYNIVETTETHNSEHNICVAIGGQADVSPYVIPHNEADWLTFTVGRFPTVRCLTVLHDNIPEFLRHRRAWCLWAYTDDTSKPRKEKPTKVPWQADMAYRAASNKSKTWRSFGYTLDQYQHRVKDGKAHGLGCFMSPDDDLVGIDIDHCIDADGRLSPEAQEIVRRFRSYTEISPSGKGVRIFASGVKPGHREKNGTYEFYDHTSTRFLTVSGHHLPGTPLTVNDRQAACNWYYETFIYNKDASPAKAHGDTVRHDRTNCTKPRMKEAIQLLCQDERWAKLWEGKWEEVYEGDKQKYPSRNEADLALCGQLAYYLADADMVNEAFKQSGLYRDKWDRQDYRDSTIVKAMDKDTFFDWDKWRATYVDDAALEAATAPFDVPSDGTQSGTKAERTALPPIEDPYLDDERPFVAKENKRGVDVGTKPKFKTVYTDDELDSIPSIPWHISRQCHRNDLVCLYGDSGVYKSFFALDWGLSGATGTPWLGCYDVLHTKVFYVCSEAFPDLPNRRAAWKKHHNIGRVPDIAYSRERYNLCEQSQAETILQEAKGALGEYPGLIIIDTLDANTEGDENDGKTMKQVIRNLCYLRDTADATVVVVHHQGKDKGKGLRGHSSLKANLDCLFHFEKVPHKAAITVSCQKQKASDLTETYILDVRTIELGGGEDQTSVILELKHPYLTRFQFLKAEIKAAWEALIAAFAGREFTTKEAETCLVSADCSDRTARRYLDQLQKKGFVAIVRRGVYQINSDAMAVFQASY